ncbi:hypothetical protein [Micromonospora sp. NBS 11-29]|uniref:hypothetical protein n=1 Tax=Micromonospora sp. NBS 11-29 TaxID=1960879 RepID=UPI0020CC0F5D|nr:hypothetical protein [Micromonospora sp. NBS 11-29]
MRDLDPSLADLGDDHLLGYARRNELLKDLPTAAPVRVDSPEGTSVDVTVYPLLVTPQQLREYQVSGQTFLIALDLDRRVRAARADGCDTIGLGFGLGGVSGHGAVLRVPGVTVTAGSALAVGSALATARQAAPGASTLAVVGGGGRVGSALAALSVGDVEKIVLVGSGRPDAAERLRAAEHRIYQEALSLIAAGGELTGIAAALAAEPPVARWLAEGRSGEQPSAEAVAAHLHETYGSSPFVVATDDLQPVRQAQLVFSAHSSPVPVLDEKYLADGAVVCDLSFFGTGAESAKVTSRDDLRYVRGGLLCVQDGKSVLSDVNAWLSRGELLAGAVEPIVIALSGSDGAADGGPLTRRRVDTVVDLARRHGFEPVAS